jgi:hypothetical protein
MAYLGHGLQAGMKWCGRVHGLGSEAIRTEFVFFGLPLVPTKSVYFLNEYGKERRGYDIPLHPSSVIAGYLRYWGFMGAVFAIALGSALGRVAHYRAHEIEIHPLVEGIAISSLLTWVLALTVLGRTGRGEASRRAALQAEVGIGADPRWLGPDRARANLAALREKAANRSLPSKPGDLRIVSDDAVRLAYALACYADRLESGEGWREAAEALELRMEALSAAGPGPIVAA